MENTELKAGGVQYLIGNYENIRKWAVDTEVVNTKHRSRYYYVPYLHRRSQHANTASSPSPVNTNTRPTCRR